MDLIKTTPPELAVPFHVVDDMELNALVNLSENPGIDLHMFRELGKRVLRDTRGLDYKKQIAHLEYLALRVFTKQETTRIVHKNQARTLSMGDYEPAERPVQSQQFRPDDDLPPAA